MIHDEELRSSVDYSEGQKQTAHRVLVELVNLFNEYRDDIPFKGRQGTFATYNCGFCHAGISTGSKYCHRCGRKVDLEHSDILAIKDEVIFELPDPEEEIVPEKRRRSKDNDVEGQSSIFDMLEGE